jgi:hypothetical protein
MKNLILIFLSLVICPRISAQNPTDPKQLFEARQKKSNDFGVSGAA